MACSGSPSAHLGQARVGGVVDERLVHGREDNVETVQHRGRGTQDLHTQHKCAPPAMVGTRSMQKLRCTVRAVDGASGCLAANGRLRR